MPFRWLFKGEYSLHISADFVWYTWSIVGVFIVTVAAYFSIRALLYCDPERKSV